MMELYTNPGVSFGLTQNIIRRNSTSLAENQSSKMSPDTRNYEIYLR